MTKGEKTTVVVFVSSYHGHPPDNATKFMSWIKEDKPSMSGVSFAVFGVGNARYWQTYMQVPKDVDEGLEELGGERVSSAWVRIGDLEGEI